MDMVKTQLYFLKFAHNTSWFNANVILLGLLIYNPLLAYLSFYYKPFFYLNVTVNLKPSSVKMRKSRLYWVIWLLRWASKAVKVGLHSNYTQLTYTVCSAEVIYFKLCSLKMKNSWPQWLTWPLRSWTSSTVKVGLF